MSTSSGNSVPGSGVAPPPPADGLVFVSGCGLLVSLIAAVFWPGRDFGLAFFDDGRMLAPLVADGATWEGAIRAFGPADGAVWQPLTTLSLMLDAAVFGSWWGGYHLHNAVLHALATVLLFAAVTRLTGALGRGVVAAAVFAIHPLRAESVAWIAGRADVLGGVCFAGGLLAYAWFVERPDSWRRFAAVAACVIAGVLCNPALVMMPLGLLILDWWPLRRLNPFAGGWGFARPVGRRVRTDVGRRPLGDLVVEKLPLFAIAAGAALAVVFFGGPAGERIPFPTRVATAVDACAVNALHLVWPVGLAPVTTSAATGLDAWRTTAAAAGLAAVTAGAWFWRRRWPSFTAGWAWYLLMSLPLAVVLPQCLPTTVDRGSYFSQVWLIVAIVWGMADRLERLPIPKLVSWSAALAGLLLLTWGCWAQARVWHDFATLWRHTLATVAAAAPVDADPASWQRRAAARNPTFAGGWLGLGDALRSAGLTAEAEEAWRRAVAIEPGLATGWSRLAHVHLDRGNWRAAMPFAEKGMTLGGGGEAAVAMAWTLSQSGQRQDAVATLRRALDADPASALVLVNLATLLEEQGEKAEAAAVYRRAAERLQAVGNASLARSALARAAALQGPSSPSQARP